MSHEERTSILGRAYISTGGSKRAISTPDTKTVFVDTVRAYMFPVVDQSFNCMTILELGIILSATTNELHE